MIPKDIKALCDYFDVTVCTDIATKGFSKALESVYYIGATSELSAGLYGFRLTPHFFSEKALVRYCASKRGQDEINAKAKETFPDDWLLDYRAWFEEICDGCIDIRGINASEHKCHTWSPWARKVSDYYMHKGERRVGECQCPQCSSKSNV